MSSQKSDLKQQKSDRVRDSSEGRVRYLSGKFDRQAGSGVSGANQDGSQGPVSDNNTVETHNTNDDEEWVCTICSNIFRDENAKLLECDYCHKHTCAKCLKFTNTQYATTQREDLLWICGRACHDQLLALGTPRMGNTERMLEKLVNRIESLESLVTSMGKVLGSVEPNKILAGGDRRGR